MLRKLVVHKINENKNKVRLGKKHIEKFADILKEFKRKCYFYPTNEQGLSALIKVPTTSKKCRRYPKNGFAKGKNNLKDIWGNRYLYQRVGNHFYVKSLGAEVESTRI
jgi:general secretion pathway protein G